MLRAALIAGSVVGASLAITISTRQRERRRDAEDSADECQLGRSASSRAARAAWRAQKRWQEVPHRTVVEDAGAQQPGSRVVASYSTGPLYSDLPMPPSGPALPAVAGAAAGLQGAAGRQIDWPSVLQVKPGKEGGRPAPGGTHTAR
jgi:hypothetical protein